MSRRVPRATSVALIAAVCLLTGASRSERSTTGSDDGRAALPARAAVDAYLLGSTELVAGSTASYRVAVHWASAPGVSGPLPGARVTLSLQAKDGARTRLAAGTTGAQGSLHARFAVPHLPTGPYRLVVHASAPLGSTTRETAVRLFPGGRLLLTTDKRLYQPAQTIHIRALALRSIDLRPVANKPVRFRVLDPKGNAVYAERRRSSRFGVAAIDFPLADEINLGRYTVEAVVQGAGSAATTRHHVEVKRYVLPKFKVAVEAERSYYLPGDTVRGTVRCRYFFGKPVAGARVTLDLRSTLGRGTVGYRRPELRTDAQGRASFELTLIGDGSPGDEGEVRLTATAVDSAGREERGDLSIPFAVTPLQLSVVTENAQLVPHVRNRVHVVAGLPDGRPAAGVTVGLTSGGLALRGRTDALGVASFAVRPRRQRRGCGERDRDGDGGMTLRVAARDRHGHRRAATICAPLAPARAVLVRPAASLVAPGQPVELEVMASARRDAQRTVYVDVVKGGQTLATFTRTLHNDRASVRFTPDAALFGLLELRGYRLAPDGERQGTSRMVYVDHPGALRIAARADRPVYRPGSRATLHFQTTDSRTGDGVQAALGLLAVDEAVAAMGGLEQSAPKVFFTLAAEAKQELSLAVSPGGRPLTDWVTSTDPIARRARAADVLLAAVRPADNPVWETNPWKERREAWAQQAPALIAAAVRWMAESAQSLGRRTSRGWRFDPQLVSRLAAAKRIERDQVEDPWRRAVRPWHLRATDASFAFAPHAARVARDRLEQIYDALGAHWESLRLRRERMKTLPRRQWPLVLPAELPARLLARGQLKPQQVVDPWGQRYRAVRHGGTFVNPYHTGLVSRYVIHSAGPDGVFGTRDDVTPPGPRITVALLESGALGADAESALGGLIGNRIGEAYGVGGLGLRGVGMGGGGFGEGTIGLGSIGTIGHGGGGMPARVRSVFPETLLWQPELVTDGSGRASLGVDLADSITSWRVLVTGSTTDGLLGTTALSLRVFQDFFVDIDLPVALTQRDRVSVPVTVYNYLKTPQRVTLRLQREDWFAPRGALEQTIELAPSQVGVRHFPIVASGLGRRELTVHATAVAAGGKRSADAVRRATLVEPDGVEHAVTRGGTLRKEASAELAIPAAAIPGTASVQLAMYGGPMGPAMKGLEGMLRMPGGCFEQTSSTTYPNVLVLDYLKRTRTATPTIARKAKELITAGYQRLVSFEVPGGGFSWFGRAPANKVLTAYGLMEFHDMARVHPVDPKLIARTQRWLAGQQRKDGSFGPDGSSIDEGATTHYKDALRITAYVAHALRQTGYRGPALDRALRYVRKHAGAAREAYTLAVIANLLVPDEDRVAHDVRARLWRLRRAADSGLRIDGPRATLTYGAGRSGHLESTALAALGLLGAAEPPADARRLVDTLVASKDSFGSWHSTQATILSLRALLLQHERTKVRPAGELRVLVDGRSVHRLRLDGAREQTVELDLTRHAARGKHRVALRFAGQGSLQYHLVGRYWLPRQAPAPAAAPAALPATLALQTRFARKQLKAGDATRLVVEVGNRGEQAVEMPLVALALPPGFAVAEEDLTGLVTGGKVDKVQRVGSRALLYLSRLKRGEKLRFAVRLTGKYPLRVQARPSAVYEYYRPENRSETAPQVLEVL